MVTYTLLALVHLWVHITVSNQNYVNSISGVANAYKYLLFFFLTSWAFDAVVLLLSSNDEKVFQSLLNATSILLP